MKKLIQKFVERARLKGVIRSEDWAGDLAWEETWKPGARLLDVGCGDGSTICKYVSPADQTSVLGLEGATALYVAARARGILARTADLNSRWPCQSNVFDVVFSNQVIEHVHNTRMFIEETFRVLEPGGTAVITSENLCSLLNTLAMVLGYAPFSLMQVCGRYVGNPLGQHSGKQLPEHVPITDPAYAGVTGHIRVLTCGQAKELFEAAGFVDVEVRSIAILPLPDILSQFLELFIKNRGHYLLIKATKPIK